MEGRWPTLLCQQHLQGPPLGKPRSRGSRDRSQWWELREGGGHQVPARSPTPGHCFPWEPACNAFSERGPGLLCTQINRSHRQRLASLETGMSREGAAVPPSRRGEPEKGTCFLLSLLNARAPGRAIGAANPVRPESLKSNLRLK